MKSHWWLIANLCLASGISWAQCTTGSPGPNCSGSLSGQPPTGNTRQSAITLVDLGLPVPAAVVGQSCRGTRRDRFRRSPGIARITGAAGPPGTVPAPADYNFSGWGSFSADSGWNEIGNALYRNQIDLSAVSVRLVLTLGMYALPSGSFAEAEYTPDGINWYALSGRVPVTTPFGLYTTGWQGMPTGANGDYVVRIITFNSATVTTQVSLYQLHLQFK